MSETVNDYTVEQYDNPRESRAWYEKFLREHNGRDWQRKLPCSVSDLVAGHLPRGPDGQTSRIFWYRIKYKGVLVGYADAKIHSVFNGSKIVSDVWILPKHRKQGHFHSSFPALVEYTNAVGICITMQRYRSYGGWFVPFGFEWLCAFGTAPSPDPENATVFLTTKDAYKDMLRWAIKYDTHGLSHPLTERGRMVFEEVKRELEQENISPVATSDSPAHSRVIKPHKVP